MTAGFAQVSGSAMRRQSGVVLGPAGALVFSISNPSTIRLADVVDATVVPPPPVPIPDPGPHSETRALASGAGGAQRVVVLPSTLAGPTLTYEGRDVVVVRL